MRSILIGTIAGLLAFTLAWTAWHLWNDHNDLHALVQIEQARQRPPAK